MRVIYGAPVLCSGGTRMRTSVRAAVVAMAAAFCSGLSAAQAADAEYCKGYASAALHQVRGARTNPACAPGAQGARWAQDYRVHYDSIRVAGLQDLLAHQGAGLLDRRVDEAHPVVGLVDVAPDFEHLELAVTLERLDGRQLLDRIVDRKALRLLVVVEGKQRFGPLLGLRRALRRCLREAGGTNKQGQREPHREPPQVQSMR